MTQVPATPVTTLLLLNWNGWEDTIECLESLQHSTYPATEIVVLDNGSSDDSINKITTWAANQTEPVAVVRYSRKQAESGGDEIIEGLTFAELPYHRRLILVDNGENLGFAAGNNVGIRFAIQRKRDYIFLLNNDTVVQQDAIQNLVSLLQKRPELVGVTGRIRYYDSDRIWNCGGRLTWYGSRKYYFHGKRIAQTPQNGWMQISFITGCAAMFATHVFCQTGLLTEQFFFGEEDYELSLRLKDHKMPLACCFDAVILHKVGRSIHKSTTNKILRSSYIYYLSRGIDLRQHWSPIRWQLWVHASMIYILPMLWIRHDIQWKDLWMLRSQVLRDCRRLDSVDKTRFERAVQGLFD